MTNLKDAINGIIETPGVEDKAEKVLELVYESLKESEESIGSRYAAEDFVSAVYVDRWAKENGLEVEE